MSPTFADFIITINETAGHLTIEAQGPGQVSIEPSPLNHDLLTVFETDEQLVKVLSEIEYGLSPSRTQMERIGGSLFELLFVPTILEAFGNAHQALSDGTALRLRLNIRPPKLARLPWELLFHPHEKRFLAKQRSQPLVRFLDTSSKPVAPPLRLEGPLRVLVVQSEPLGFAPLNLAASALALKARLGDRALVDVLENATPSKLRQKLHEAPFHVLHYDGHALFDQSHDTGFLALENEESELYPLAGEELSTYLDDTPVRLVVLASCQTGRDSSRQRFVGVAQHLMRTSNLPAIVAMQYSISDHATTAFIEGFYGALANDGYVDMAVASGRMKIVEVIDETDADWATPILFMRTTESRLWTHWLLRSRAPYMGLEPFREEDADFFFGRETLVESLLKRIEKDAFLAVLGPSGSGKSSLVRAGLLPALKDNALPGSKNWHYLTIKPTHRPLDTLAARLAKLQRGKLSSVFDLRKALAQEAHALLLAAEMMRADNPNTRLVLVVDQFEELWTLAPKDKPEFIQNEQLPFIRLLLEASQLPPPSPPLLVILTMRADFLHRAAENHELARAIEKHLLLVSPMPPLALQQAIEKPAKLAGGQFEDGLVNKLIEQVTDRPGSLPLLSYALLELWKAKHPNGSMTWEAYRTIGGVEGALAARADAILQKKYTPSQQNDLRHLLLRLVQPGEGTIDSRRRAHLDDLVLTGMDTTSLQLLLKPLVDERLLTTDLDPTTKEETVEISHEALIRAWPTFAAWIEDAREDLRFQLQLEQAAKEWEANEEKQDYLWGGLRLGNAQEWLERVQPLLNERDERFLEASRAEERARVEREEAARQHELALERRARRQLQALVVILSLALFVSVGVLAYPKWLRWRAIGLNEMVTIPSGVATIGSNEPGDDGTWPSASFEVDEFEIGRYEITNEQYCLCRDANYCDSNPTYDVDQNVCDLVLAKKPVTNVTLAQANKYCEWIGQRLPTEIEWEWVARGIEKRSYPTGHKRHLAGQVNLRDESNTNQEQQGAWAVGSAQGDQTPDFRVQDMTGNVHEWTISHWLPYNDPRYETTHWPTPVEDTLTSYPPGFVVMRGGSWKEAIDSARAIARHPIRPNQNTDALGFRCLR